MSATFHTQTPTRVAPPAGSYVIAGPEEIASHHGLSHWDRTGPFDVIVTKHGMRIPIGVTLCGGCDAPLINQTCEECQ